MGEGLASDVLKSFGKLNRMDPIFNNSVSNGVGECPAADGFHRGGNLEGCESVVDECLTGNGAEAGSDGE